MSSSVDTLKSRLYDLNALHAAIALMDWDQQTYMPRGGGSARAEHVGVLSRMAHETLTDDATGRAIDEAAAQADPDSVDAALVRVAKRSYDLSTRIPADLVAERSRLAAQGHEVWVEARHENDFARFRPVLERMVEISREIADRLGYTDHVYDALLDQYEEGATAADCRAMFDSIRGPLVSLVQEIKERSEAVDDSFLYGEWDPKQQAAFTESIAKAIGFSFDNGRQDTAPHPFCTNFSVADVRLTTRFKPYLASAIFGTLHEAGHGMYEQGSPLDWDRLPLAGGVSLGVHESQSRLWENIVGRSRQFWSRFLPDLKDRFHQLAPVSLDTFYTAVNKVQPSLIRVEADEVTYNLHIMVRFETECAMLTGELAVADLPEYWNAKYEEYLGIRPPSDSDGCLQDVHWSGGMIGYFPTYSMGNLLSYQIWEALGRDLPNRYDLIEAGEFEPILNWLQEKVYRQGSRYTPKELVLRATGKPMGASDYLAGITAKYRALYGS